MKIYLFFLIFFVLRDIEIILGKSFSSSFSSKLKQTKIFTSTNVAGSPSDQETTTQKQQTTTDHFPKDTAFRKFSENSKITDKDQTLEFNVDSLFFYDNVTKNSFMIKQIRIDIPHLIKHFGCEDARLPIKFVTNTDEVHDEFMYLGQGGANTIEKKPHKESCKNVKRFLFQSNGQIFWFLVIRNEYYMLVKDDWFETFILRELWNNADFTATFEVIARALLFYDEVHNEYKLIDAVKHILLFRCTAKYLISAFFYFILYTYVFIRMCRRKLFIWSKKIFNELVENSWIKSELTKMVDRDEKEDKEEIEIKKKKKTK